MLMIAFWLAIVTFFIPKKFKQICGYISIGISAIGVIYFLFCYFNPIYFGRGAVFYRILDFGWQINPIDWIYRSIRTHSHGMYVFINLLRYFNIGIAFVAMKISVIKYESDKEFDSYTETTSDEVTSTSDGKLLRVIEVNAGLCTGTLRGAALEARINQIASQGWKFEQFETIIGRCCLFFPRYKAIICFSKEN